MYNGDDDLSSKSLQRKRARVGDDVRGSSEADARARERFARELQRYASDSDDEGVGDVAHGSVHAHSSAASTQRSFFDVADDVERAAQSAPPPPGTARDVGRGLLARMQEAERSNAGGRQRSVRSSERSSNAAQRAPAVSAAAAAYTPLSTGGFMDTSAEYGNVHRIKVGDVVYFRQPTTTTATATTTAGSARGRDEANADSRDVSSPTTRIVPSPTAAAPSATVTGEQSANAALATHFCRESALSEEERRYGRRLTHAMLYEMGEVTRLDKATASLEVLLLDGTRVRRRLYDVRPAGYVEQALYADWKAHPQHRPARLVAGASRADDADATAASAAAAGSAQSASTRPWWVLPRLVVRITAADAADEWRSRVCVVRAVRRKDNVVRLSPYVAATSTAAAAVVVAATAVDEVVEVKGQDGLSPVLPPCGQAGIVVLGERRGEQAVVLRTHTTPATHGETNDDDDNDNSTGDTVTVLLRRTGEQVVLAAHEVCMLDQGNSNATAV